MSTFVFCCEACPGTPPPRGKWRITRHGDVITTWACDKHLGGAIARLAAQRPDLKDFTVRAVEAA